MRIACPRTSNEPKKIVIAISVGEGKSATTSNKNKIATKIQAEVESNFINRLYSKTHKQVTKLFPLIGILCFIGLYLYSSTLYPGGSQANLDTKGFDWVNNYWCNLMNKKAMNGAVNPARPFSILAMLILCLSLMLFFLQFAQTYSKSKFWRQTIKVNGILSMFFASLIFTKYHDLMTVLSSLFGIFVVTGIIRAIYKSKLNAYKISGVFCILLLGLNNYIYYTHHYLSLLPLLQKCTFAIVLAWIIGLNLKMIKENEAH